uniref:Si:dkeyp-51f11.3 n=1 Tax=Iconisemion striatum TaxID=60296 RepID=A0A1A7YKX2_9TELE
MRQEQAGEDNQIQRVPLVRTRSFGEMKYGQGQVHYPLPDFSKVAPKVRIPKTPSGPVRSIPPSPKPMHGAESSPGMLEVIGRVLEDSIQPSEEPYVFKSSDEQTPAALVHHLQVEYDKLLTRYAEAENRIDQIRLGTNPSSEHNDAEEVESEGNPAKHLVSYLPAENVPEKEAEISRYKTSEQVAPASPQQHGESPSDGERMTAELRDIISQFKQKVEDLRFSVSSMAINTAEQQMMLRSMMEAQDQLERTYISKRDEHRALEMQNYMGLSRNTGTFDPDSDSDPPLSTSCVSQRIVSPETDSGFGSSYLNQSASGTFQQNSASGSVPSQSAGLSGSDSDGSRSNLDTEIHSAQPSVQTQLCGAAAAVELWVESTTKEPPLRLQGGEQKHHVSEPVLSTTIDANGSPPNSCSCSSEVILALQAEVSRLKKNLEEGLVQLPHLAQRMDYLTSKYKEERQERRSQTRSRLTPTFSSIGKSSSRDGNNFTSSQLRIDDWISSDMDPSKSKGPDSGDGSCSEIMLEIHPSPEGSRTRGGSVHSLAEFGEKLQRTSPSHRGTEALKRETGLSVRRADVKGQRRKT